MKKKSFLSRFNNKTTPKKWKSIRNTAAGLFAAIVAMGGVSATIPTVATPIWFTNYAWYIGAVLAAIIAYAQSREDQSNA